MHRFLRRQMFAPAQSLALVDKGNVLRKLALVASLCVLSIPTLAHAQQVDIAASGSTLLSGARASDQVNFHPPVEKGGTYVGLNGDYIGFRKRRLGFNIETVWRRHLTTYPYNNETYRPFFTDTNALYESHVARKFWLDLMAGVGVASYRFSLPSSPVCNSGSGGCVNYSSSNHFMEDLGAGLRYRAWRGFFVRPEIRYYHIQNNVEFNSPNVFRGGASVGYTFGGK